MSKIHFYVVFKELCGYTYSIEIGMKYNKVVRNNYLMGFAMKIQLFLGYKRHLVDVYLQISQMFKIPVLYVFKELCGYTYSIEFCMKYNKEFLKKFPFFGTM